MGIVIILLGEERHKKYEYAAWPKTYEFEMVFGIKTDTFDALGLITNINDSETNVTELELKKVLQSFKGKYKQTVPPYSAIKVKGKPLHWYARNSRLHEIDLPSREGEIYDIALLELKFVSGNDLLRDISETINKVPLEFNLRQNEVTDQWQSFAPQNVYQEARIRVEISKGLYIRQLSQDISTKLKNRGFVHSLIRTHNGDSKVIPTL